jgi:hypothetical protein
VIFSPTSILAILSQTTRGSFATGTTGLHDALGWPGLHPKCKKASRNEPAGVSSAVRVHPRLSTTVSKTAKRGKCRWLDRPEKQLPQTTNQGGNIQRRFEVWLRELAVRRCIWCWYGDSEESMGLWNSYGPRGVAVVSSVGRIRKAFPSMGHVSKTFGGSGQIRQASGGQF